ncbi:MAG: hypothetical protein RMM31_09545 [Anaerolineae bacterium]|nr:hypothetical protein [Thermoflexales bacterium]MDW8396471.1 hypothetical protein [Anaerolineae bacterium]
MPLAAIPARDVVGVWVAARCSEIAADVDIRLLRSETFLLVRGND